MDHMSERNKSESGPMRLRRLAAGFLGMLAFSMAMAADIGQYPLFLAQQVKPNIMFTLDNSGSMEWSTITGTDGLAGYDSPKYYNSGSSDSTPAQTKRAHYASAWNKIYYNPDVTYAPAVNYDGSSMGASSITAARIDPFPTASGTTSTVKLDTICYAKSSGFALPLHNVADFSYSTDAHKINCYTPSSGSPPFSVKIPSGGTTYTFVAPAYARFAFYYKWAGGSVTPDGTSGQEASYTRVDILSANYPMTKTAGKRDDCVAVAGKCTYDEEIKNFANWFSYYRTRILMAKTAMGQAFSGLDTDPAKEPRFRMGFNTINNGSSDNAATADGATWLTIRDNRPEQKKAFFDKFYAINPGSGTPLRYQMERIGKLFAKGLTGFSYTNNDPYYLNNQYNTKDLNNNSLSHLHDTTKVSCRASYHIMTTDGYWNGTASSVGDVDNADSGYSTRARGSYDGGIGGGGTLADIALYYYKTDLRTDLANNVPTNQDDPDNPSTHQHVVMYTVGMGANGTLKYTPDYETATSGHFYEIKTNTGIKNWPKPLKDEPSAVDDLWHAAVNGRGKYYVASNPTDLRDGLIDALAKIDQKTMTASTDAVSSTRIGAGEYVYEPSFKSGIWTGHLKAYAINADGSVSTAISWDAAKSSNLMPTGWANRNIATWNGAKGVPFTWPATPSADTITAAQKIALGSEDVQNYLRGDGTKEKTTSNKTGIFRERTEKVLTGSVETIEANKLGDIVNSSPLYVKATNFGYSVMPGSAGSTYNAYVTGKTTQTPFLFVGANDGMMHAFNATSGEEKFAFIPASVYSNLKYLSQTDYSHKYYVDGQMTENDVYAGGWKTILLGAAGAGARSVFAINITTPAALATDSVLWEKSDSDASDGADMGYVLGEAKAVQMVNGDWVVLHGNGFSSSNKDAKLFVRSLSSGTALAKLSDGTAVGTTAAPNGLSTPALLYNTKRQVIAAYAGDVYGNLWKFKWVDSLSNPTTALATASPTITKLFTATNDLAQVQPIIQKPALRKHPQGGYIVAFGTGKYFDSTDGGSTDTNIQSLYGIWDNDGAGSLTRGNLQKQTLTAATDGATVSSVAVNWQTKRGWYVDLSLHSGERAIANPLMLDDVFYAKTLIPQGTICSTGGDSYLYGIDYLSGGANAVPTFGTMDVVKLSGGGTSGLRVVQTPDGKFHIWTKKFDGTGTAPEDKKLNISFPGFRTWRQVPVGY